MLPEYVHVKWQRFNGTWTESKMPGDVMERFVYRMIKGQTFEWRPFGSPNWRTMHKSEFRQTRLEEA